jgi:hypothetical protein
MIGEVQKQMARGKVEAENNVLLRDTQLLSWLKGWVASMGYFK